MISSPRPDGYGHGLTRVRLECRFKFHARGDGITAARSVPGLCNALADGPLVDQAMKWTANERSKSENRLYTYSRITTSELDYPNAVC